MVYVIIPNGDLDQDSPITQPLMTSLRDNIEAVALQLDDAPAGVVWHPYDMVEIGDGATGVIYDWAVDGLIATVTSPVFEPGYNYMFMGERLSQNSGSVQNLNVGLYRDTAAAWSGAGSLGQISNAGVTQNIGVGYMFCRFLEEFVPDVPVTAHLLEGGISSVSLVTNLTAFAPSRYYIHHGGTSAADTISQVRFYPAAGSLSSGKIKMFKRKHNRTTGA